MHVPDTSSAGQPNPPKKTKLTDAEIRKIQTKRKNDIKKGKMYDIEKCSRVFEAILLGQRQRVLGGVECSFLDDISQQMALLKRSELAEDRDVYAIWERALFYYHKEYNITQKILGLSEVDMGKA